MGGARARGAGATPGSGGVEIGERSAGVLSQFPEAAAKRYLGGIAGRGAESGDRPGLDHLPCHLGRAAALGGLWG